MTHPTLTPQQRQEVTEATLALREGLGIPLAALDTRTGEQVTVIALMGPDGSITPVFQLLPANASTYLTLPGLTDAN